MKSYTLNQEQMELLTEILSYVFDHEFDSYQEWLDDCPEIAHSHIYALATKLSESL